MQISIKDWRRISIAFTRRFLRLPDSTSLNPGRDTAEDDEYDDVYDLQATQSTNVANRVYAIQRVDRTNSTNASLFRAASMSWYNLLCVGKDPNTVADSRASHFAARRDPLPTPCPCRPRVSTILPTCSAPLPAVLVTHFTPTRRRC